MKRLRALIILLAIAASAPLAFAQDPLSGAATSSASGGSADTTAPPDRSTQVQQLRHAMGRLPVAAGLACLLALRPRRRGTPRRQASVIQTQIILSVVGAVVMLVVGTSLARAFGIVGAAGLVRYRAKIDDPKDAGVMLSTLAIGLASGVGLWMLAAFSTVFILFVLWIVESFEPTVRQLFLLTVKAKDPAALKPKLDALFNKHHIEYALRATSTDELAYELHLTVEKRTDRLSNTIMKLDPGNASSVEWDEKKEKK